MAAPLVTCSAPNLCAPRPTINVMRIGDVGSGNRTMPMTETAGLAVATFAQRPDLLAKVFDPEIQSAVPEFMRHDPVAALYYGNGQLEHYSEFGVVAVDPAE